MTRLQRVGVFGGMFDPIHCGHLDVVAAAERALGLAAILIVPSNIPPHREQPLASPYHRFAMVAMVVAGRRRWRACDLELSDPAPSYTARTLRRLHDAGHTPLALVFITGADAFLDIGTWHEYPAVLDLAHFAVVSRPGVPAGALRARLPHLAERMILVPSEGALAAGETDARESGPPCIFLIEAATADVSSTAIRRARQAGRSIAGLVPEAVQQHIEQHGLYLDRPRDARAAQPPPGLAAGRLHGQD